MTTPVLDPRPTGDGDASDPRARGTGDGSTNDASTGAVAADVRPGARTAAFVALLAVLVAALGLPTGPLTVVGRVAELVAGPLEVRDEGSWRALSAGDGVPDGAVIRTVGGTATLAAGDGRLTLTAGAQGTAGDGQLALDRGSVLVEGAVGHAVVVDGVLAAGRGTWRVDAGRQPRVAAYDGQIAVDDGRTEVTVPAYRQLTARDRAVGGAAVLPLRYLPTDDFDRTLLADAIRVDELAGALARSLAGTYGQALRPPDFYAAFVVAPLADDAELADHLRALAPVVSEDRTGPPAAVLLGALAVEAVTGVTGREATAVTADVAALRDEGATWGLILQVAGADAEDLQAAADRALDQAADDPPAVDPPAATDGVDADEPAAEVAPAAPDAPASGGGTGGGGGATTGSGGTAGGGGGGGGGGAPTPTPTSPSPSPPRDRGALAPVEDTVRDLGGTVGGTVEDVTDAVGDVVGGLDELLSPTLGGLLGD